MDAKFVKTVILTGIVVVVLLVVAVSVKVELSKMGDHTGYEPDQPINFSHKLHAGEVKGGNNGMPCLYCHFGAEKSKHSGIPPVNVCWGCHKTVQQGIKNKTPINKLVNFKLGKELEETLGEETVKLSPEISKIYKAVRDKKSIEWVKVHNLPDFVYYNHSQHLVIGGPSIIGKKVKSNKDVKEVCQTCHGPIEKMDKVRQFSALTMKRWCLRCHRGAVRPGTQTPQHPQGKSVTETGGMDCVRCHY